MALSNEDIWLLDPAVPGLWEVKGIPELGECELGFLVATVVACSELNDTPEVWEYDLWFLEPAVPGRGNTLYWCGPRGLRDGVSGRILSASLVGVNGLAAVGRGAVSTGDDRTTAGEGLEAEGDAWNGAGEASEGAGDVPFPKKRLAFGPGGVAKDDDGMALEVCDNTNQLQCSHT